MLPIRPAKFLPPEGCSDGPCLRGSESGGASPPNLGEKSTSVGRAASPYTSSIHSCYRPAPLPTIFVALLDLSSGSSASLFSSAAAAPYPRTLNFRFVFFYLSDGAFFNTCSWKAAFKSYAPPSSESVRLLGHELAPLECL